MDTEEEPEELGEPADKLVLVVDDEEDLLELMERVVKKEGFRTEKAADGREALAKILASPPDLLILDFMLPYMGGYELLRELQARGCGDVPIIVVTGRSLDSKSIDMIRMESNVKEFMQKPIRPAAFAAALHVVLRTRPPEVVRAR